MLFELELIQKGCEDGEAMTDIEERILKNQVFIMNALIYMLSNQGAWNTRRNLEINVSETAKLLTKESEDGHERTEL